MATGIITISTLQRGTEHRAVKRLAQGHTARERQNQDQHPALSGSRLKGIRDGVCSEGLILSHGQAPGPTPGDTCQFLELFLIIMTRWEQGVSLVSGGRGQGGR